MPMCPTSIHRCIPIMIQRRALQTRILKMEINEKCWSPLYMQSREDCKSSRLPIAPGKPVALLQERGARANRTRALDVTFVSGTESIGETCCNVFIWKRRTGKPIREFCLQKNLGRSLLEGNKDHVLSQARSELMKQEHQVEPLNYCISELQQQTYTQRLEVQDAQHG